jgi:hypothetical protein
LGLFTVVVLVLVGGVCSRADGWGGRAGRERGGGCGGGGGGRVSKSASHPTLARTQEQMEPRRKPRCLRRAKVSP